MMSRYQKEYAVAVQAAQRAARRIRAQAGSDAGQTVREKGPNDLVTATDEAAEAVITSMLTDAFPAHEILSEESEDGTRDEIAPVASGYRWIIDPLDGTTNFVFGVPPFAVSIALQHEREIVVGVVLDVPTDTLYTAVRGEGAYCNGVPLTVSSVDRLAHSLIATGFPFRVPDRMGAYMKVLGTIVNTTRGVRRHGAAAIDLAWVARGAFTGYFETGISAWDIAAGLLLVEEAGGRVTDFRGRSNPLFAGQLIASNGAIHDALLEHVQPIRDLR